MCFAFVAYTRCLRRFADFADFTLPSTVVVQLMALLHPSHYLTCISRPSMPIVVCDGRGDRPASGPGALDSDEILLQKIYPSVKLEDLHARVTHPPPNPNRIASADRTFHARALDTHSTTMALLSRVPHWAGQHLPTGNLPKHSSMSIFLVNLHLTHHCSAKHDLFRPRLSPLCLC